MAVPAAREPGALGDSLPQPQGSEVDLIGLLVGRWIQCSAAKS